MCYLKDVAYSKVSLFSVVARLDSLYTIAYKYVYSTVYNVGLYCTVYIYLITSAAMTDFGNATCLRGLCHNITYVKTFESC